MKQAAPLNRKLSDRLPQHKPDRDVWAGIEGALPGGAAGGLHGKLPVHRPNAGLWTKISQSLPHSWYATYRNYLRALAVILLLLPGWYFNLDLRRDHQEINLTKPSALELAIENKESQQSAPELSDGLRAQEESLNSQIINESENNKLAELQQEKPLSAIKPALPPETENLQSGTSQLSNPTLQNTTFDNPKEKTDQIALSVLPAKQTGLPAKYSNIKSPKIRKQNGFGFNNPHSKLLFEAGIYVQPTLIQNISTVNDDRNYSTAVGISVAMHIDNFILESGVSYRELAFDDKIAWDYYHFEFVGTLINTEHYELENYISEQGDSLVRRVYQIELVDVYDSLYVEEEKIGRASCRERV